MNNTPKVVITNSVTESPWENATVAGGDLAETINQLKAQTGDDIITYGGGTLVRDLIAKGLLDELHLFVNPVALGAGMPVFAHLDTYQQFSVVKSQTFDCGVTVVHLEPKRS
jgi:dihydrofolate reductase